MIKIRSKKTKANGKDKKKQLIAKAREAVSHYEACKLDLEARREEFQESFPEACQVIEVIEEVEASTKEAIDTAKSAVAKAEMTIGEFKFVPSKSSAGYDPAKLLEHLCSIEASLEDYDTGGMGEEEIAALQEEANHRLTGELLKLIYQRGLVTAFKVNKDAAQVVMSSAPDLAAAISDAWDEGGKPLTPRIYTPKI